MVHEIYERFDKLKESRGVTVYAVSKATGITTTTFTNWKKGKYVPKRDKMQLIADYFNVSVDYLMTGKEKENAPKFSRDHIELIGMYSKLNETQKKAVFDLLRSFLNE